MKKSFLLFIVFAFVALSCNNKKTVEATSDPAEVLLAGTMCHGGNLAVNYQFTQDTTPGYVILHIQGDKILTSRASESCEGFIKQMREEVSTIPSASVAKTVGDTLLVIHLPANTDGKFFSQYLIFGMKNCYENWDDNCFDFLKNKSRESHPNQI
jgi:hypothetical protein